MFSMAMWMAALVAPIQILAGDAHGLNTLEHQPAKVLAMEGDYRCRARRRAADPVRPARATTRRACATRSRSRKLGSLILKHDPNAPLPGLTDFPRDELAAGADRVLVVPDHGRRSASRCSALGLWSLVARMRGQALRLALAAPRRRADGAGGLRRGDRRLGHDRGRPPALYGLWPAAHRAVAFAARARRRSPRRCSPS